MSVRGELGECTSGQLSGGLPTLLIPVGSTEQHGPHLPLDTDTRIATAVAHRVGAELAHPTAPAIAYGASGEHQGFPGTVSIGTPAMTTVLVEYGRSACEWADRLVFVNGHGGNAEALCAAVGLLRREGRDAGWCSCSTGGGDAHAGHTETSLLLHLSSHLVLSGQIAPGNVDPLPELLPRLRRGGIGAVSRSGVLGDPSTATATAGGQILAAMVADCAARIRRWTPGPGGMLR